MDQDRIDELTLEKVKHQDRIDCSVLERKVKEARHDKDLERFDAGIVTSQERVVAIDALLADG